MIFILTFIVVFVFNLYVIIFGKKDLEKLKSKISIKKYLEEINESLVTLMGKKEANMLKICLILLSIVVVIFNAFFFIECLLGVVLGIFSAKKSYQISSVSNVLNKIATYINRLK